MALRPCIDCGTPCPGPRCDACRPARERARGTRQARGYDAEYDRDRRRLDLSDGELCRICQRPGTPDDPLVADHVVQIARGGRGGPLQPAHRSCNARKNLRRIG